MVVIFVDANLLIYLNWFIQLTIRIIINSQNHFLKKFTQ